ncbi:hypothetical protein AB1Y20_000589 [Prymnesium parvum]|uniref:Xylose isomerase-like TIM barrel domain-containing protein n=1 Tax=Prymnesium parvum TaxID=97485 RepID=A0AB34K921_PRYPA
MPVKRSREETPSITLSVLGFCGADDSVEPLMLSAISAQHPWVEWGILFREDKMGQPRYASFSWLKRLGEVNSARTMRLAGHLCGGHVSDLLRGDMEFVRRMHEEVGFQRFQVNATAANGVDTSSFTSAESAKKSVSALRRVFAALSNVEFIVQRNAETRPLWERLQEDMPSNVSLLFDDSMGLGKSSSEWPSPPPPEVKFGYAGGLGDHNISSQLSLIDQTAPGRTLWVDMESSLRTTLKNEDDIFDCNKAMACVRHVIELGLKPPVGN